MLAVAPSVFKAVVGSPEGDTMFVGSAIVVAGGDDDGRRQRLGECELCRILTRALPGYSNTNSTSD